MLNKLLKSIWWLLQELVRVVVTSVVEVVLVGLLGVVLLSFIPQIYLQDPLLLHMAAAALLLPPLLHLMFQGSFLFLLAL
jgi:hypothetical protein